MIVPPVDPKIVERWMSTDADEARRKIFRAYNDVLSISGIIKQLTRQSDFLTEDEKSALSEWADEIFWEAPKLSGIADGAIDAAIEKNEYV